MILIKRAVARVLRRWLGVNVVLPATARAINERELQALLESPAWLYMIDVLATRLGMIQCKLESTRPDDDATAPRFGSLHEQDLFWKAAAFEIRKLMTLPERLLEEIKPLKREKHDER